MRMDINRHCPSTSGNCKFRQNSKKNDIQLSRRNNHRPLIFNIILTYNDHIYDLPLKTQGQFSPVRSMGRHLQNRSKALHGRNNHQKSADLADRQTKSRTAKFNLKCQNRFEEPKRREDEGRLQNR